MGQSVDAALVAALSRFDAALEVGVGRRTTAAAQLASDGTSVVAIDVDSGAFLDGDAVDVDGDAFLDSDAFLDGDAFLDSDAVGDLPGSVAFVEADVHDLAGAPDPVAALRHCVDGDATTPNPRAPVPAAFDLVYALNLPAELQRPTVELAGRLGAVCAFTTLGFEEPVVDVERRTVGSDTLYVASGWGANTNTDAETNTNTDAETNTDANTNTDAETNTDANTNTDADTNTVADADAFDTFD